MNQQTKLIKIKLTVLILLGIFFIIVTGLAAFLTLRGNVLGQQAQQQVARDAANPASNESAIDTLNRFIALGNELQAQADQAQQELTSFIKKSSVYQNKIDVSLSEIAGLGFLSVDLEQNRDLHSLANDYQHAIQDLRVESIELATLQIKSDVKKEILTQQIDDTQENIDKFLEIHAKFMRTVLELAAKQTPLDLPVRSVYTTLSIAEEYLTIISSVDNIKNLPEKQLKELNTALNQQLQELPTDLEGIYLGQKPLNPEFRQQYGLMLVELNNLSVEIDLLTKKIKENRLNKEKYYMAGDRILTAYNDAVTVYNNFTLLLYQ